MSGAGYVGKTVNWSRDVVGNQAQAEREDQWGEMSGEIVDYDPAAQTATIQPLYRPRHLEDGEPTPIEMPLLYEVPIRFERQGGLMLTYPVKPGDIVNLRPQMRSSEKWHTEKTYEATDTRSASLADYEAYIAGGESLKEPIANMNTDASELRSEDGSTAVRVGEGFIELRVGGNVLRMDGGGLTVNATRINLN